MKDKLQFRNFVARTKIRESDNDDDKVLEGVGMVYGSTYENWWGELESMKAGCFTESLEETTFILWSHKMENLLGNTTAETATITDDKTELAVECQIPNTQCGKDTYELVKRGDVEGMSVGFWLEEYEIKHHKGKPDEFIITKADLVEVSFVANPAYKSTSAVARSIELGSPFPLNPNPDQISEIRRREMLKRFNVGQNNGRLTDIRLRESNRTIIV